MLYLLALSGRGVLLTQRSLSLPWLTEDTITDGSSSVNNALTQIRTENLPLTRRVHWPIVL
jgi:hypothetical protein